MEFDSWKLETSNVESRIEALDCSFEEALSGLEPLDGSSALLVQTSNPAWTAVLSNHWQGGQQFHLATRISERMRVDRVDVDLRFLSKNEETGRRNLPSCHFAYSIPVLKTGGDAAHVQVSDQGNHAPKWDYYHSPNYMPFEDVDAYQRRRIADRFTPEMLNEYCKRAGVDVFDEDFYSGPIFEVVQKTQSVAPSRQQGVPTAYAEAQRRVGVEPVKE